MHYYSGWSINQNVLLYHGTQVFGKSLDNPSLLTERVFGIMLICLNRGPSFLTKLIPISKLTSAFLFEQSELTVHAIRCVAAAVKVSIYNGNRVNQVVFKIVFYTTWKTLVNWRW